MTAGFSNHLSSPFLPEHSPSWCCPNSNILLWELPCLWLISLPKALPAEGLSQTTLQGGSPRSNLSVLPHPPSPCSCAEISRPSDPVRRLRMGVGSEASEVRGRDLYRLSIHQRGWTHPWEVRLPTAVVECALVCKATLAPLSREPSPEVSVTMSHVTDAETETDEIRPPRSSSKKTGGHQGPSRSSEP